LKEFYLSLDAGTSGGKATIVDGDGLIRGFSKTAWSQHYTIPEDLDLYGCEFDAEFFWKILLKNSKQAIAGANIDSKDISAVTATSQRHGCVFLDKNGKELYSGPNRDARGLEIDTEEYMDNEELFEITGHGLPFLFSLPRLLWFRENNEDLYENIKHLLSIDGWVNYRLTGKYAIDDTSAAETLLYDIKKRNWSTKILSEFEIPDQILPEFLQFGQVIGNILPEVARSLDLNSQIPIIMSAADTQASLLGCQAFDTGSLGVVAGSTMPIMMIIDQPIVDPDQKLWTGAFINNLWVAESNAGSAGDVHKWFVEDILQPLGVPNPYEKFESLALSQPVGSRGVFADLGPSIFSAQSMVSVPEGGGFTFLPISYSLDTPANIASFARALLENLAYAVRANTEQIQNLIAKSLSKIHLVGGLSRSKAFNQILANVMDVEIQVCVPEGASVGGSLAAMIGTGKYKNIREALDLLVDKTIYYPQADQAEEYDSSLYPEWKEIFYKSRPEE
jgi:autoinducer 2 (AI-2) kinase